MESPIQASAPTQITIHPAPAPGRAGGFFAGDAPSISDAVDVINPLQHIPFVNTLYRELTGDTVGAGATMAGGALFGGVFGFFAGLANVVFESATGESVGDAVIAALNGERADPNIQLASNAVNLGDFAGDMRRNICSYNCSAHESELAQTTVEPTTTVAAIEPVSTQEILPPALPPASARSADADILALFGTSAAAANSAYKKADMRAYLNEASTNLVL